MSQAPPAPVREGPALASPPAGRAGSAGSPLLTIAVPTYNRAPFLAECLGQLVAQLPGLEDRVEFLVSDNASTDGTAAVVAGCAARIPALRSIRSSVNVGADENFIRCLKEAPGEVRATAGGRRRPPRRRTPMAGRAAGQGAL